MNLDMATLLAGHLLLSATAVLMLAGYGERRKTYPGYRYYVAGAAAMTAGFLFFLLRVRPGFAGVSVVGANTLFLLSGALRLDGARRFLRGTAAPRAVYAAPAVGAAWCAWFFFAAPSATARALLTGLLLLAVAAAVARLHLAAARSGHAALHRLLALLFLTIGGMAFMNGLVLLGQGGGHAAAPLSLPHFGLLILAELGTSLGVALLHAARLEDELTTTRRRVDALLSDAEAASAEVRTLEGLFPLCPVCKRVRDDDGYWKRLELYLGERTGGSFSHGLCPDCAGAGGARPGLTAARPSI